MRGLERRTKMNLTTEFFDDVKSVRDTRDGDALERLVQSTLFVRPTIFHGKHWSSLRRIVNIVEANDYNSWKEQWYLLLRPALFLAICDIDDDDWNSLWVPEECSVFECGLYNHLVTAVRGEIEQSLLDGGTLRQVLIRDEQEWPEEEREDARGDVLEAYIPDSAISDDDTEDQAMANLLVQEIQEYLDDDDEWVILTSDYGYDDDLAAELGIQVDALRKRRERIKKRIDILFR